MTYKEIPLTNSKLKVKVSPEDFDYLIKFKWYLKSNGYACRSTRKKNKNIKYLMHRVLMEPSNGVFIDHIDRDKLNNTRENLRFATHSQNNQNKQKRKNSTSKFIGVSFRRDKKLWRARICIDKINISLGYFKIEAEAARAYNNKAIQLYGEKAKLNPL